MSTKELGRAKPVDAPSVVRPLPDRKPTPFDLLQTEIDRVFDTFNGWPMAALERNFSPDMEVVETDTSIEVTTELPGLEEKDVEISVADGLLVIRGEKKTEKSEKRKNYRIFERNYGAFERTVALPRGIDPETIKATMSKGVLKIEAPKPAGAKGGQVRISAS